MTFEVNFVDWLKAARMEVTFIIVAFKLSAMLYYRERMLRTEKDVARKEVEERERERERCERKKRLFRMMEK